MSIWLIQVQLIFSTNFTLHTASLHEIFRLKTLTLRFNAQQVYMYFRGSGKAAEMKKEAARQTMMVALWHNNHGVVVGGGGLGFEALDYLIAFTSSPLNSTCKPEQDTGTSWTYTGCLYSDTTLVLAEMLHLLHTELWIWLIALYPLFFFLFSG